jgi:hypothetical protein
MQASLAGVALSKQSTFAGLRSPKGCLLPPFGEAGQRLTDQPLPAYAAQKGACCPHLGKQGKG